MWTIFFVCVCVCVWGGGGGGGGGGGCHWMKANFEFQQSSGNAYYTPSPAHTPHTPHLTHSHPTPFVQEITGYRWIPLTKCK